MKIKIQVRTPKGQATKTNKKLKLFIVGKTAIKEIYISPDDDEFIWVVECDIKRYMKIARNITMFDNMIQNVFKSKIMNKALKRAISAEQRLELEDLLRNHTTVSIVKKPTSAELAGAYDSWWDMVKAKFRRQKT